MISELLDDKAVDCCPPVTKELVDLLEVGVECRPPVTKELELVDLLEVGTKLDEPGVDCESGTIKTPSVAVAKGVIAPGDDVAKSDANCATVFRESIEDW